MKRKIISIFLIICLLSTTIIFAQNDTNDDYVEYFKTSDDGRVYLTKEKSLENGVRLMTDLKQLSTPTGLTWHVDASGDAFLGRCTWNAVENCEGQYRIEIFCNDESEYFTNWRGLYDHDGTGIISVEHIGEDIFNKSGKYTFTVKALGDGINYSDSEVATSKEYDFVCPDAKLETPEDVHWLSDGVLTHKSVPNAGGYFYTLYDQNMNEVGSTCYANSEPMKSEEYVEEDLSSYMRDILGWSDDEISGIYVKVKALTYNIEEYQNSDESECSDLYDIESLKSIALTKMDEILEDLNNGNITAVDALDSFLEAMENEDVYNTDIALSMQQSESLVDTIKELEDSYCEETGINVNIKSAEKDSNYLEDRGINTEKISVIGAALNSNNNSDVDINFSKADESLSFDELFYKNSVAVDISADGVKDKENLDIPIQIKMPVPKGVLPDRLVILHYHADGCVETIYPAVFYENGEAYVSFVLTSFSSFVFCNETEEPTATEEPFAINVGEYVQMGTYYGKPILWRCVDIDENGPLMLSDKIICLKPFDANGTNISGSHGRGYYYRETQGYIRQKNGSNYWADSNMRDWLNSTAGAGDVVWSCGNPPDEEHVQDGYNEYDNEAGFLSNFTANEINAIKTVTQKSLLDGYEYADSENIINPDYHIYALKIDDILKNYSTAFSEQVTDKMFLLDIKQLSAVYTNRDILGEKYYIAFPTEEAVSNSEYENSGFNASKDWWYWLRSPATNDMGRDVRRVAGYGDVDNFDAYYCMGGIRPAFYLKDGCIVESGDGTKDSPYIVYGNEEPTETDEPSDISYGDVTGDEEINISDVVMLVKYIGLIESGSELDETEFPNGTFPAANK